MPEEQEQKYCYLVKHADKGSRVFYYGRVYTAEAARDAVEYAENLYPVIRLLLQDESYETSISRQLNVQFANDNYKRIFGSTVELPNFPVEAILSSVG